MLKVLKYLYSKGGFLVLFLIQILIFFVIYKIWAPCYMTNDDVGMMLEVAGAGRGLGATSYLVHAHVFIGFVLKNFYNLSMEIPWYGLYMSGALALALTVFLALAFRGQTIKGVSAKTIAFFVFLILCGAHLILNLQFTISASLVGLSGICVLFLEWKRGNADSWKSLINPVVLGGILLVIFGTMIRWKAAWLFLATGLPMAGIYLILRPGKRMMWISGLLIFAAMASYGINEANRGVWNLQNDWGDFYEFNRLRGKLSSNNPLDYLPPAERDSVLQTVDWSANDYRLFKSFYFLDEQTYSIAKLGDLLEAIPLIKQVNLREAKESMIERLTDPFVVNAFIFYLFCLFFFQYSKRDYLLVLAAPVFLVVLFSAQTYYFRAPPMRVYYPMTTFIVFLPFMLGVFRGFQFKGLFNILRLIGLVVSVVLIATVIPKTLENYDSQSSENKYNHSEFTQLMSQFQINYPDNLIVTWGANFCWEFMSPFDGLEIMEKMDIFHVGCSQRAPSNQALLEKYEIDNLFENISNRDDIILVSKGKRKKLYFKTYMKEKYQTLTDLEPVFETQRFSLFRGKQLKPASEQDYQNF